MGNFDQCLAGVEERLGLGESLGGLEVGELVMVMLVMFGVPRASYGTYLYIYNDSTSTIHIANSVSTTQ